MGHIGNIRDICEDTTINQQRRMTDLPEANHGAGIFTYITGPFLRQIYVNIRYMEHMGLKYMGNIGNHRMCFGRKWRKPRRMWVYLDYDRIFDYR